MVRRFRSTGPDVETRNLLLKRDGGCIACGAHTLGLQVHHRKPRRMGGRAKKERINLLSNLIILCADDHLFVESRREQAYESGWLVRECDEPAEIPAEHWLYGLVYLLNDGTVEPVPSLEAS